MSHPKTEEIKIRVPSALKQSIKAIAGGRYTSESEIVREAIIAYLSTRPTSSLQETAKPSLPAASVTIVHPVSYRKTKPRK